MTDDANESLGHPNVVHSCYAFHNADFYDCNHVGQYQSNYRLAPDADLHHYIHVGAIDVGAAAVRSSVSQLPVVQMLSSSGVRSAEEDEAEEALRPPPPLIRAPNNSLRGLGSLFDTPLQQEKRPASPPQLLTMTTVAMSESRPTEPPEHQFRHQQHRQQQEQQERGYAMKLPTVAAVDVTVAALPSEVGASRWKRNGGAQQQYQCPGCTKRYCRRSTLTAHLRQHSGERPYWCPVCGKSFSQAANLTAHRRVHTGEKPFSCPICARPFSQSSSLVTHKRTHTGEKPYPCPYCPKAFTDSSTLTKHVRTHTGYKPYICAICTLRFTQSGNLHRHMKTHREVEGAGVKLDNGYGLAQTSRSL